MHPASAAVAVTLLSLAFGWSAPAASQDYVDLQLVIAVDMSRSIEGNERQLQRQGYVAAFRSLEVQNAIESGPIGSIAVTYIEWSNTYDQRIVVPWRVIGNAESSLAFADELAQAPVGQGTRTSISGALTFAYDAFLQSEVQSTRRTIDISGDGANNDGRALPGVRARLVNEGITINGLPLLIGSTHVGDYTQDMLDEYYEDCVIGGPAAFIVAANGAAEFERAIRRKLLLEIAEAPLPIVPVAQTVGRGPIDCQKAER